MVFPLLCFFNPLHARQAGFACVHLFIVVFNPGFTQGIFGVPRVTPSASPGRPPGKYFIPLLMAGQEPL